MFSPFLQISKYVLEENILIVCLYGQTSQYSVEPKKILAQARQAESEGRARNSSAQGREEGPTLLQMN